MFIYIKQRSGFSWEKVTLKAVLCHQKQANWFGNVQLVKDSIHRNWQSVKNVVLTNQNNISEKILRQGALWLRERKIRHSKRMANLFTALEEGRGQFASRRSA